MAEGKDSLDSLLDDALADFKDSKKTPEKIEEQETPKKSKHDDTMKETLRMLQQSLNNLNLDENPTEEELEKMFADLSEGFPTSGSFEPDEAESFKKMLPMMETIMQSLLSKELLYPPLKELSNKYPEWLANSRQTMKEDEFERFNKQFETTKQLCHEFETEDCSMRTEEGKKRQFERIFELMQKMQSFGHPPSELVQQNSSNSSGGFFQTLPNMDNIFDASGDPVEPEFPNDCKTS